jgi:hypothetical protein
MQFLQLLVAFCLVILIVADSYDEEEGENHRIGAYSNDDEGEEDQVSII